MEENVKLVVVGNGGVGKTCLLISYAYGTFPGDYVPTVFDNYEVYLIVGGKSVHLGLWDTAGGEEYHRLRPLTYVMGDIFLMCFSICHRKSFEAILAGWYPEVKQHGPPQAKMILVGCKGDLRKSKQYLKNDRHSHLEMDFVSSGEGHKLAQQIGAFAYIECSAYELKNVHAVFEAALKAQYSEGRPLREPKSTTSNSMNIISAIKKKVKNITFTTTKKDDDRLVVCTQHDAPQCNLFAHASVYAKDKMFVFGGYKNINNDLAEFPLWKGKSGHWEKMENMKEIFTPRACPCAVLVRPPSCPSGKILIFGGKSNGYMNYLMSFDPVTMEIEKLEVVGKVPSPRYGMAVGTLNEEMFVFGGYDKDSEPCNDFYKFNFERKEWIRIELTGEIPSPRVFHSADCVPEWQSMVIYGGKSGSNILGDMYSINCVTGECKQIVLKSSDSPGPRQNHTCTYVGRGTLVLVGGLTKNKTPSNDVFLFSLDTQKWTTAKVKGFLPKTYFHSSIFMETDSEIWISGGKDEKENLLPRTTILIAKNAPNIFASLPIILLKEIFRFLPPPSLARMAEVNKFSCELSSDKMLWKEIAICEDPSYDAKKDGDPKAFYITASQLVWYNDFSKKPVPPQPNYIQPGASGWDLY